MTYPPGSGLVPAVVYARCSFTDVANAATFDKGQTYDVTDAVLLETLLALGWVVVLDPIDPESRPADLL